MFNMSVFMFFIGSLTLLYINFNTDVEKPVDNSGTLIDDILSPLKGVNEDLNVLVLGGDKLTTIPTQ